MGLAKRVAIGLMTVMLVAPVQANAEPASRYIVVLNQADEIGALTDRLQVRPDHIYDTVLSGFSASLTKSQLRRLSSDKAVSSVVADSEVRGAGEQTNPGQWGLDRIDQRNLPLDNKYRWVTEAENVTAYILDTGVRRTHAEFGGRVLPGVDIVDNDGNPNDDNGHGTFMAGIIGSAKYGVAKKINIVPVRVLNGTGSGTISGVIAGIDWITRNARKPAVVNMSIGGSANAQLDDAVRRSIASGVTYVVSSGSSNSDVRNFSPARVVEAITTAATDIRDCVHSASNYGPGIDLHAPGVNITGPWNTSDTATNTISGSAISAAHVTGGAGLYLADHPTATPAQVQAALTGNATTGVLCNLKPGSPNRLLYTLPS